MRKRRRTKAQEEPRRPSLETIRRKRLEAEEELRKRLAELEKKCGRPNSEWLNRVIDI